MLSQETQARLTQKHLRGVSDIVEPGRADKRVGVLAQALRRPTSHGRHSLYMALSARQRALQILPRRRLRPLHQTHHFNIGSRSANVEARSRRTNVSGVTDQGLGKVAFMR